MAAMPTWEGFMVPCLSVLSDGATRSRREMNALAADAVGLSDDQRATLLSSVISSLPSSTTCATSLARRGRGG